MPWPLLVFISCAAIPPAGPVLGWAMQRPGSPTARGGRPRPSDSMGAFLIAVEGLDDSLRTPCDGCTPSHHLHIFPKPDPSTQPNPLQETSVKKDCMENTPQIHLWGGKPLVLPMNQATSLLPLLCTEGQPFVLHQQAAASPGGAAPLPQPTPPPGPRLNACHPDCGGREITGERRYLLRRHQTASEQG